MFLDIYWITSGDSNKYTKHMFYEEIRAKQDFLHTRINLFIKYSVQKQIHFKDNFFWNKCCRCNEGSLYARNALF